MKTLFEIGQSMSSMWIAWIENTIRLLLTAEGPVACPAAIPEARVVQAMRAVRDSAAASYGNGWCGARTGPPPPERFCRPPRR